MIDDVALSAFFDVFTEAVFVIQNPDADADYPKMQAVVLVLLSLDVEYEFIHGWLLPPDSLCYSQHHQHCQDILNRVLRSLVAYSVSNCPVCYFCCTTPHHISHKALQTLKQNSASLYPFIYEFDQDIAVAWFWSTKTSETFTLEF